MVTVPLKSIYLMKDTVVLLTLLGMGQLPFRLGIFIGNKKRRNATKTRFSTIQSSIDVAGIRNER